MTRDQTIVIRREVFDTAYEVVVLPPPVRVGHDREFQSLQAARAYAADLSRAMSWPAVDLCDDAP